jgi:PRTRC genetic system ThiF family protein
MNEFHIPEHLLNREVRIQIAGAGGTGSQFCEALASLEVTLRALGHPGFSVTIFDDDRVSRANVGRQRYTHCDVTVHKAHVLVHRLNLFFGLNWTAHARRLRPEEISCDVVVTATDSALFRAAVGKAFRTRQCETLWLDMGNGPATAQAILSHLGQPHRFDEKAGKHIPTMRIPSVYDLYPELAHMKAADTDQPSCSVAEAITRQEWPINRLVATAGTTLLWNLFREGKLAHHGCVIDSKSLKMTPMAIDPAAWEFYGVKCADKAPKHRRRAA